MAGVEHLEQAALDRAEGQRLGHVMTLPPIPIEIMHPAPLDQRPVGGRHAFTVQRAGEVDPVLVLGIVAVDALCVPDRLHHLFICERPRAPWPRGWLVSAGTLGR